MFEFQSAGDIGNLFVWTQLGMWLNIFLDMFLDISQPTHCTQRRPIIVPPSFPSPSTRVPSPSTDNPAAIAHQHFQRCGCQKCPCRAAAHSRNMRFTMDLPVHLPSGSNVQCALSILDLHEEIDVHSININSLMANAELLKDFEGL